MIVDRYDGRTKAQQQAETDSGRRQVALNYATNVSETAEELVAAAAKIDDWLRTGKVPKGKKPAK